MAFGAFEAAADCRGLRLLTAEGRILPLRFTGKLSDRQGQFAHIDIFEGLPAESEWR
jgi:hypothetical protein